MTDVLLPSMNETRGLSGVYGNTHYLVHQIPDTVITSSSGDASVSANEFGTRVGTSATAGDVAEISGYAPDATLDIAQIVEMAFEVDVVSDNFDDEIVIGKTSGEGEGVGWALNSGRVYTSGDDTLIDGLNIPSGGGNYGFFRLYLVRNNGTDKSNGVIAEGWGTWLENNYFRATDTSAGAQDRSTLVKYESSGGDDRIFVPWIREAIVSGYMDGFQI